MKGLRSILSRLSLILSLLAIAETAMAHKGHSHQKREEEKSPEKSVVNEQSLTYSEIRAAYDADIAPIFRKACFDCHSSETKYPWYANLPFAKSLIEDDITEAKKHIDMTGGFPFKGHGSVTEDLQAIEEDIRERTMPPLRYRLMHWQPQLTETDREKIFRWIHDTLARLRSEGK